MAPVITTDDNELEVVTLFTYLESRISSGLTLDTEIGMMIVKSAITFTHLPGVCGRTRRFLSTISTLPYVKQEK